MKRARICTGFLGLFAAASWLCAGCGGEEFRQPAEASDDPGSSGEGGSGATGPGSDGGSDPGEGGASGQGGSEPSGDCDAGETRTCYSGPAGTEALGACLAGIETCDDGSWGPCIGEVLPSDEDCTTESDEDCDGEVNQGCACIPGSSESCYSGPAGTQDVGACKAGTHACDASGASWGACLNEVLPAVEDCANPADEDCSGLACAQTLWSKIAGDASDQRIADVAVDGAGNIYVAGSFEGTISLGGSPLISTGSHDVFVAKYDATGAHVWSKKFGDSGDQLASSLAVNAGGTVALVGSYKGAISFGGADLPANTSGSTAAFLAKLDSSGNHLLSKQIGQSGNGANAVAIDGNGRVVVGGSFTGCFKPGYMGICSAYSEGGADGYLVSYSPTGAWEWDRKFGNASAQYVNAVELDPAGNVIFAATFEGAMTVDGTTLPNAGYGDVFVAKLDPTGKYAWKMRVGGSLPDEARDLVIDASGNAVLLADFQGTFSVAGKSLSSQGGSDVLLAHISSGGVVTASETFGGTNTDRGSALARDADGNLLLAGVTIGSIDFGGGLLTSAGDLDVVVAKLTSSGAHIWSKRFGDSAYQSASAIAATPSKELIVAALVKGTIDFGTGALGSAGGFDMAFAKFAP